MKSYDSGKRREEVVRKAFEDKFKFKVKGRGKSRKAKMDLLESMLSQMDKGEDLIITDPEANYYK